MDGATTWGVFWRVVFPLLAPINATVGILTCVWAWNDFLLPLVILSDPEAATIQLAQYVFQGQLSADYTLAFASYLIDGTAAHRLRRRPAVGDLRCHQGRDQVARTRRRGPLTRRGRRA